MRQRYAKHNGSPRGPRRSKKMTTTENIRNIELMITKLDDMISDEKNVAKRLYFFAIRDHCYFAAAYLRRGQNDRAGIHLDAAKTMLKRVGA